MDAVYLLLTVVFFGATWALAIAFERARGER